MTETDFSNVDKDDLLPWQTILFHEQSTRKAHVIIDEISELSGLSKKQILGPSRLSRIVWPRRVAMWRMRTELNMSLEGIGKVLNRDHTTVMKALEAVKHVHDKLAAQPDNNASKDQQRESVVLLTAGGKP